ncbi:MAG: type II toxin-antitoxin system VapC family toxin [Candidatus Sumerlaeia bacterium]
MRALDTNVLVRFLMNDDEKMGRAARRLLAEAHERGESLLVVTPVVLELIWVLKSTYALSREDILDALGALAMMPVLQFESADLVHDLIHHGRSTRLDLPDLLIALCAKQKNAESTWTFDSRAVRSGLFRSLS